ncbi:DNA-binding transcriptional regulator, LysR family [Caldanaerovirga acetigignens]|uniref:DNA-binding transcriptional regulator, LysR family n=1 Tax=Caldanaerovirga acetigignens TaxID=447595 RepID=A0A1M7I5D4_9FIRM|nr:LysR family transcriptional regulator [Caldanaerovirga acetigignens]SHM35733.1 DNA-binding transcriptional regulator, LysR family [Caldanaerovirga acetigignens]
MEIDMTSLKYFVLICKNKSFSKTAEELFITQQALSKRIQKLEKQLGTQLFERTPRGVTLTEAGRYVLSRAELLVKTYEEFVSDVKSKIDKEKTTIKIGFAPGTLQILGVRAIIEFEQKNRDIHIEIAEFSDIDCEANVLNGTLDLALTVKPKDLSNFIYHHLIREKLIVIVNKANPLSDKKSVRFEDLKNEKLILLSDTFRIQPVILEHFEKAGFAPKVYFKSSHDLKVAYDFVELNQGIFIFVDKLTHPHIEEYKNIKIIPIDDPTAYWDAGFILKKGTKISKAAKKFIDYFIEKYKNKS